MGGQAESRKTKKRICVGLLAHVDAGKTTLSEALLYKCGEIRSLGRVDRKNTYLDHFAIERERGITIFSKQAVMGYGETEIYLLDTPGHVDFSAEMERTLQILDCAVLVISGTDGVQAHTQTLWRLLKRYGVPTIIFVTKMDISLKTKEELTAELKKYLSGGCMDFTDEPDMEEAALLDDELFEKYMAESAGNADLRRLVEERKLFPVLFGSGLKLQGVDKLLETFENFAPQPVRRESFGAKVYKISRDAQGQRMSWVKLTGGSIKVRDKLKIMTADGEKEEKVSQIRVYSGTSFTQPEEVQAGCSCALLGLESTYPGQGIGCEGNSAVAALEPVFSYRLCLPPDRDPVAELPKLMQLEEEDPQLHIAWNPRLKEINIQLMGEVQTEIIRSLVKERFGFETDVDAGRIMYRETISSTVEGVGHFEPLRHYAEVHLLLEPGEPGSGLVFDSTCSEDLLDRSWQRLILTHLEEKCHLGVLTGSPITDMKISLVSGRAHIKHTEGGDFRQATYRAVRQGLMKAQSVLLEPYYDFTLELPSEQLGRAINDIRGMKGEFTIPESENGVSHIRGSAPVSCMRNYAAQVMSYSRGRGRFSCRVAGYRPCRDTEKVLQETMYDPERDVLNSPDSVFCAHGAGFNVRWNEVEHYMHLDSIFAPKKEIKPLCSFNIDERELEAIMEREFGPAKRPLYRPAERHTEEKKAPQNAKKDYVIVDGYNLIHAWDELADIAEDDLGAARGKLIDYLCSYRGFTRGELVLVFDAYAVPGNAGKKEDVGGIHLVYTSEGESADFYIEKLTHEIGKNYSVRVVTSDALIQLSAVRAGVLRVSAREFHTEVEWVYRQIRKVLDRSNVSAHKTKIDAAELENGLKARGSGE